jgi:hypothetical protein
MDSMAIAEAKYKVVEKDNRFEIRDYAPHILAETIVEDPIWARYNPPFTPWFLRRNEILIPILII